ncbi:MAG: hypothetical protein LBD64_07660 [Odoribacteraceae bacterium]|jgi:hypothetical protein|nr:hypothetical protein [Odoribacteraceae bacterium]
MEKYDYIEDVILTVDEGNVVKKNKPVTLATALLVIGAAALYFGISVQVAAGEIISSLLVVVGLLVIVSGIILLVIKKGGYFCRQTGQGVKKYKIYIAPDKSFKLQQVLRDGTYEELGALRQLNASNSSVEIFLSDDREYALLQALEFVPYNDIPTTPVIICHGDAARAVSVAVKG